MRPYKSATPDETIKRCKEAIASVSISPQEVWYGNPYPGLHSCTLELPSNQGRFRANGKGRDREYCLASAYAEMIERICNGMAFNFSRTWMQQLHSEHGFYVAPNEQFLTRTLLEDLPEVILADLIQWDGPERSGYLNQYYDRLQANGIPGAVSVPYSRQSDGQTVFLPHTWMQSATGSNGMAAGNTMSEAVYQALCELVERWSASIIFFQRLTPPKVPDEYLKQFPDEYELIQYLQQDGFEVSVFDFGAGLGLPALGVIVTDSARTKYRLNVGCDTSFQVALSRCMTEVVQGIGWKTVLDQVMIPIPGESKAPPDTILSLNEEYVRFYQHMRDATGQFPSSLFSLDDPHYEFSPQSWGISDTFEAECVRLVATFSAMGHETFIRDVSFLGFPVVHVYVPVVSTLSRGNIPGLRRYRSHDGIEWDKVEYAVLSRDLSLDSIIRLGNLPPHASVTDLCGVQLRTGTAEAGITVSDYLQGAGTIFPRCPECNDCGLAPNCMTKGSVKVARSLYPIMKDGSNGLG